MFTFGCEYACVCACMCLYTKNVLFSNNRKWYSIDSRFVSLSYAMKCNVCDKGIREWVERECVLLSLPVEMVVKSLAIVTQTTFGHLQHFPYFKMPSLWLYIKSDNVQFLKR